MASLTGYQTGYRSQSMIDKITRLLQGIKALTPEKMTEKEEILVDIAKAQEGRTKKQDIKSSEIIANVDVDGISVPMTKEEYLDYNKTEKMSQYANITGRIYEEEQKEKDYTTALTAKLAADATKKTPLEEIIEKGEEPGMAVGWWAGSKAKDKKYQAGWGNAINTQIMGITNRFGDYKKDISDASIGEFSTGTNLVYGGDAFVPLKEDAEATIKAINKLLSIRIARSAQGVQSYAEWEKENAGYHSKIKSLRDMIKEIELKEEELKFINDAAARSALRDYKGR